MCPPYVIEPGEIDTIIGAIRETLDEVIADVA
jgi:adenosylmethionine-8-amino-7-oxononanoate aminotransferase